MPGATLTATAEHPVLRAAARHGLGGGTEPVRLDAADADAVLARARFDHLTGFVATAIMDGIVGTEDPVAATVEQRWHEELSTCVRLEGLAVRTAEVLDETGLSWRLTKGAALAHLDYPDPAVRTFGDVDVIVHPADWPAAYGVLSAGGYRRDAPTLPGSYDARYGKGATLTAPDGLQVDLHRRLAIGRFGITARMEDLFDESAEITLAGRPVPTLGPVGRLLHACFHASLGGFRRLRAFRDVAQLILVSEVDWTAAFAVARSWRAEAVVAAAIMEAWQRLGLDAGHPAHRRAASTTLSRGDQRALALFAAESPFRAQALSAVRRLPPADVPRYLWSLRPKGRRVR